MEVAQPEEGPLHGVPPLREEADGDVVGGSLVEGGVVGLEVVVHGLHLDGEEGGADGKGGEAAAELGEEGGGEGGEPVVEEFFEWGGGCFLAPKKGRFQHL